MNNLNKLKGCLTDRAVEDVLGYTIEFIITFL